MAGSPDRTADNVAALLSATPYRPKRFLARGGIGEVWVVEHEFLGREFALKVLHPWRDGLRERQRVEAEILGRLMHPNIVAVVDFWTAQDGSPCIVMDLLSGCTVAEEIRRRGRLPVDEAIPIAEQALSALAAAHALGVVHRDIKPENLFLQDVPSNGRVLKVLDFGIARVLPGASPASPAAPTATGAVVGTPRFSSPEARRGERVDARADLYSLGLVLYEMVTGRGPFDTWESTAEAPSVFVAGVPLALDAAILQSIRANPEDRYQTAREFARALKPFRSKVRRPTG